MKRAGWKKRIEKACRDAGTYQPFFDSVIDTLARIMETRDDAQKQFEEWGGQTVIIHTNKAGAENITKNPALTIVLDCNAQALTYWKELGLTSKAYREIHKMIPGTKKSALEEALKAMTE